VKAPERPARSAHFRWHTPCCGRTVASFVRRHVLMALLGALACSGKTAPPVHGKLAPFSVLGTTHRTTTTLVDVRTERENLVTTPEHPFARNGNWTRAGDLHEGDEIETANGSTRVVAVRVRSSPPTDVYNLTIEKTHAYFAGRDALLVHNVDCRNSNSLADRLAEERGREDRERRHAEELERDVRELRVRRLLDEHRRRMNRVNLNDSGDPSAPNCAYCTMAALNDSKKLSEFLHDHGLDQFHGLPDIELQRQLNLLGLTRFGAGPPMKYNRRSLARRFEQLLKAGVERPDADLGPQFDHLLPERQAREYMEALEGNTNMVIYRWMERWEEPPGSGHFVVQDMAHALTAVRREDGRLQYVDFQDVPPAVYNELPGTTFDVVVFPTDVDWRYNRQLYAALRDGTVHPSL